MTLILTRVSHRYVMQVGDRMVTRMDTSHAFDPAANKAVVYLARNGLLTISYTGFAYLDGIPTDRWLAEKLRGVQFEREALLYGLPGRNGWLDVGESIRRLRVHLETAVAKLHLGARRNQRDGVMNSEHDMIIAGWQWKGNWEWKRDRYKGLRPIYATVSKKRGSLAFNVDYYPRARFTSDPQRDLRRFRDRFEPLKTRFRHLTSSAPGEHLSRVERDTLHNSGRTGQECEQAMVQLIKLVATRTPLVGPHCMSIFLPPPGSDSIHIGYVPADPEIAAYGPWIVGPSIALGPSVITGGAWFGQLGSFPLVIEGPQKPQSRAETGGVFASWDSQKRPKLP